MLRIFLCNGSQVDIERMIMRSFKSLKTEKGTARLAKASAVVLAAILLCAGIITGREGGSGSSGSADCSSNCMVNTEDTVNEADVINAAGSAAGNTALEHEHIWAAEYKTIHHDAEIVHHEAEYATVRHEAVTEYFKVVDSPAYDEQVLLKEAYDEQVVSKEAWDEQVPVTENVNRWVCSCGEEFDSLEEWKAHDKSFWDTDEENRHSSYSVNSAVVITGYDTVHHDAVFKTVHHDEEYTTVHHEEVFHEEEKVTPAYDEQVLLKEAYDEIVKQPYDEQVISGWKCSICGAER